MTIRAVIVGQLATFACRGDHGGVVGWMRRPVPDDGLLIEDDETTIFVPICDVVRELREIEAYYAGAERAD